MSQYYFDNAASTNMSKSVLDYYFRQMQIIGNSSSIHKSGQRLKDVLETAREYFADELQVTPAEIIFTSGGTEGNNILIQGLYSKINENNDKKIILTNSSEHHSVLDPLEHLKKEKNAQIVLIDPDKNGIISLEKIIENYEKYKDNVALLTLMSANNETGVIQEIKQISDYLAKQQVPMIVDGVASFGHEKLNYEFKNLAGFSVSAHKFGGPQGVGFIYLNRENHLNPIFFGGGQERKLRAGTVNVPAISAMQYAYKQQKDNKFYIEKVKSIKDYFEMGLINRFPEIKINGKDVKRLFGISNITFPNFPADEMLFLLDNENISVSAGAACTAGVAEPSHVLLSMGKNKNEASSSIRFSFSHFNSKEEIDYLLEKLSNILQNRL